MFEVFGYFAVLYNISHFRTSFKSQLLSALNITSGSRIFYNLWSRRPSQGSPRSSQWSPRCSEESPWIFKKLMRSEKSLKRRRKWAKFQHSSFFKHYLDVLSGHPGPPTGYPDSSRGHQGSSKDGEIWKSLEPGKA